MEKRYVIEMRRRINLEIEGLRRDYFEDSNDKTLDIIDSLIDAYNKLGEFFPDDLEILDDQSRMIREQCKFNNLELGLN